MRLFENKPPITIDTPVNLSTESMIAMQAFDDQHIAKFISLIEEQSKCIKDNLSFTTDFKTYFHSAEGKKFYDQVAAIIAQRFGLHIHMFYCDFSIACCIPNFGGKFSVLGRTSTNDHIFQIQASVDSLKKQPKNIQEEYGLEALKKSILSQEHLVDYVKKSGVKVDLKKAYIENLPKEIKGVMCIDMITLIRSYALNPRELTAVILHEVGHVFTYISSAFRAVIDNTVLINTFLENIQKRNKSLKESLLIAYKTVTKKNVDKYKDKNLIVTCVDIVQQFINIDRGTYNAIDSEQQADQFVGRLGLGDALFSGLSKINLRTSIVAAKVSGVFFLLSGIGSIIVACLMSVAPSALLVIIIGGIVSCVSIAMLCLFYLFCSYKIEDSVEELPTYDNMQDRLKRVRMEMIRNLRQVEDVEAKKAIIAQLETIDAMDSLNRKYYVSFTEKIKSFFNNLVKHRLEVRDIERSVESLMENDLHLSAAKLKLKI